MISLLRITLVLTLIFFTGSCIIEGVQGNRNVVEKNRKISEDFNRISASRGIDVYITYGKEPALRVEADENLQELITTEVKEGTLYISATKNIISAAASKVHVFVKELDEITASSGADIISENMISTSILEVSASSGADIKLRLNVKELTGNASSGSDIKLEGKAENFTAHATSGSDIKAYDLKVKNCKASASSGADIKLNVENMIEANETSGGDIKYKGHPQKTRVTKN